jgi:branched-chain amino acid transport system ATP-binding protein
LPDHHSYLLSGESLETGYGKKRILKGVTFNIAPGEIVALIGHNGAGKSTLLKTVFGLIPIWKGQLLLDNQELQNPSPREMLRRGVVFIPQGNRVFDELTVHENLEVGGASLSDNIKLNTGIERALALFPSLRSRLKEKSGVLSGGEKQMLALATALTLSPRLLLLDEPSLGLAPPLVSRVFERIHQISQDSRIAVLIVEQKVKEVMKIAQQVVVIRNGLVSFSGSSNSLNDNSKLREVYL